MKNTLLAFCSVFILLYVCLNTCQAQSRHEETLLQVTPSVTRLLIDSIGQSLTRNYIFPDVAKKMTDYLKDECYFSDAGLYPHQQAHLFRG
jgi:hypothetical protein